MARYELTKTIEARKLNQRSGLPLGEPPISVPYSAVLDKLEESWDFVKFSYLGMRYQCPTPIFNEAARPYGSPSDEAQPSKPAASDETARTPTEPPKPVQVRWENLSSNHSTVSRAKVPGGWLVSASGGVAFYPDPDHAWDGTTLD